MQRTSESGMDHHHKPIGILEAEFISKLNYQQSTLKEEHRTMTRIISRGNEYYRKNVEEYITDINVKEYSTVTQIQSKQTDLLLWN